MEVVEIVGVCGVHLKHAGMTASAVSTPFGDYHFYFVLGGGGFKPTRQTQMRNL